jgi:hypothetical protein
MNTQNLLIGALVVQLGLAAFTWRPGNNEIAPATSLIEAKKESITAIEISRKPDEGKEADPVKLTKEGDKWVVASASNYPADQAKIDELLDNLTKLKVRGAIATQATSHEALHVGVNDYGKKLSLTIDGATQGFVLGAAASNSLHVRKDGAAEVFLARGVSEWSIRDTDKSYFKAEYIDLKMEELSSLSLTNANGTLTFARGEGDTWSLQAIPAGETADGEKVASLVRKLTKLRMNEPVGTTKDPSMGLDGKVRVSWTKVDGQTSTTAGFDIGADIENDVFLKSDENNFVVRVSKYAVEEFKSATIASLLAGATPPDDESGGMPAGMPPGMMPGMPPGMMPGMP